MACPDLMEDPTRIGSNIDARNSFRLGRVSTTIWFFSDSCPVAGLRNGPPHIAPRQVSGIRDDYRIGHAIGLKNRPRARCIARYMRAAVPALSVFLRRAAFGNTSVRNFPRAGVRFVTFMHLLPTIFASSNRCYPCLSRRNSFCNFGVDRPAVHVR